MKSPHSTSQVTFLSFLLSFLLILAPGCKKDEPKKKTFNRRGKETKQCGIRRGDGRGPYEPLGVVTSKACLKLISGYCNEDKFKQVHRSGGHFARGKFGDRIMIGSCP